LRRSSGLGKVATLRHSLGLRLGELGQREAAVEAAREAVEIRRALAKSRPDALLPALAGSLNNLGDRLSEVGSCEKAGEAWREAQEISERLSQG
jgi:hypothetical protein